MLLKSRLVLSANAIRLFRFEQGLLFQFGFDRMNAVLVMVNIFLHLQKETKPSQATLAPRVDNWDTSSWTNMSTRCVFRSVHRRFCTDWPHAGHFIMIKTSAWKHTAGCSSTISCCTHLHYPAIVSNLPIANMMKLVVLWSQRLSISLARPIYQVLNSAFGTWQASDTCLIWYPFEKCRQLSVFLECHFFADNLWRVVPSWIQNSWICIRVRRP